MLLTELDRQRLGEALALAEQSVGLSDPNPRVGCMLGYPDGSVVGRGWTQEAGGPHAEVMALRDAQSRGLDPAGATAWVTLEPCAHHGRTPPCCDALIAAGISRAVVAVQDPFPDVAGEGIRRLRAASLQVDLADADIALAAREINLGFFSRIERGRPWVRAKVAASIDGLTALPDGRSQWITSAQARADGHLWRRRANAILTGIGTVLADDPRMDVRPAPQAGQPLRVIVDSTLRCPVSARVLQPPGQVCIVTADDQAAPAALLRDLGASVLALPAPVSTAGTLSRPGVDLPGLLNWLATQGVNELHVEAGATLQGALAQADLVDEWLIYLAPVWLGQGQRMLALPAAADLATLPRWALVEQTRIGPDLRLRLRRPRRGASGYLTDDSGNP